MPNCMRHQLLTQEIVCIEPVPEETNCYWNFEEICQTVFDLFGNFKRNRPKDLIVIAENQYHESR